MKDLTFTGQTEGNKGWGKQNITYLSELEWMDGGKKFKRDNKKITFIKWYKIEEIVESPIHKQGTQHIENVPKISLML